MILIDSPLAATYKTNIEGWVSSKGTFFGSNESSARWLGCTHVYCKSCNKPTPKHRVYCDQCNENIEIEKYNKRTRVQWDQETPIYSDAADVYFYDIDQLQDFIEEHECSIDSLRLRLCEPIYLKCVDENFWSDELMEDDDLPIDVKSALEQLNSIISKQKPVSWTPGSKAILINQEIQK